MSGRIGIFSGTFDPVHKGHTEACLVAKAALELDSVLVLLEKNPRNKTGVIPAEHRKHMLELATKDYPSLRVTETGANNLSTKAVLDYLQVQFAGNEYWYIAGSDILPRIKTWQDSKTLFTHMNICVVLRSNDELGPTQKLVGKLQAEYPDTKFEILPSVWSPVSSSTVKNDLLASQDSSALHPEVLAYAKAHGLYL